MPLELTISHSASNPAGKRPESLDAVLARNLVVARTIAGITQRELAELSGVSRATIAQLETGVSDPRLSTIVDLARALGIAPLALLSGSDEARALGALVNELAAHPLRLSDAEAARVAQYLASGLLKDRLRAARLGAAAARQGGYDSPAVPITAAIFTPLDPESGTAVGAALGRLLRC